jgi:hypothetical protein
MTAADHGRQPITEMIGELNRSLQGWKNYFRHGYPRMAPGQVSWYIQDRLVQHLQRRSQRPFRPRGGRSNYEQLQALGLRLL